MKKYFLAISILIISSLATKAQIGGNAIYSVLSLHPSAKTAALGLDFLPCFSDDITAIINNPSTLRKENHNDIGITYTTLFSGINQASLAYSHTLNKIGGLALGVQYLNYGSFDMTEENGDIVGKFNAADYVFTLSWGKMLDSNVYIGANLKPVFSQYESYNSFALAIDLAASYQSSDRTWAISLMARNMGKQIKKLANEDFSLPFDLQLAASKKLAHAPLTIYAAITNLHQWNLREDDPLNPRDEIDLNGEITKENKFVGILDNTFRHLQVGVEFTPSKYFYIAAGYSWKQNREMYLKDAFSLAGLSYGIGINYSRFRLCYSRNEYHRYGAPNYISLIVQL
ncbi:MAG: type IX secretion system protein PorQ [Bacteroidales bacterium]|nr:type IX secretion system protein PorQ [Bacteroidales bacterium]